jgi:signal peptidase II
LLLIALAGVDSRVDAGVGDGVGAGVRTGGVELGGLVVSGKLALLCAWSSRRILFVGVVVATVLADQISKFWAVAALTHAFDASAGELSFGEKLGRFLWQAHPGPDHSISVLDSFWHFHYVENPGAAFSMFASVGAGWLRTPFLLLVSLAAMVFIVVYYRRTAEGQFWVRLALAFVFAGAAGNFIDRIRFGYVIDFIVWHWYDKAAWPTFNVADAAITVGVAIMLLEMTLAPRSKQGESGNPARAKGG